MIQLVIEAMNGILNHTNNTNMWLPNAYIMQLFQTIRIEIGIVTFVWFFFHQHPPITSLWIYPGNESIFLKCGF